MEWERERGVGSQSIICLLKIRILSLLKIHSDKKTSKKLTGQPFSFLC